MQYKPLHHEESLDNWIIQYVIYIPKGFLLSMLSGGFCSIVLLTIRLLEARPKYRTFCATQMSRNNKVRKTWRLESVVIPSLIGTHSLLSRIAIFKCNPNNIHPRLNPGFDIKKQKISEWKYHRIDQILISVITLVFHGFHLADERVTRQRVFCQAAIKAKPVRPILSSSSSLLGAGGNFNGSAKWQAF